MKSDIVFEVNPVVGSETIWRVMVEKDFVTRKSVHVHYLFSRSDREQFYKELNHPLRVKSKVLREDQYQYQFTSKSDVPGPPDPPRPAERTEIS